MFYFYITDPGIFLENNFKYRNAHNNEFGGAISANYGGFFTLSCLLFDIFRGGNGSLVIGLMGHFKFQGANSASRRPRNIPADHWPFMYPSDITLESYK